jgi:BirA family transcriptional regulator, biotin operon repressor / biotin---[acetyl-CoA-carboxylase] ligase
VATRLIWDLGFGIWDLGFAACPLDGGIQALKSRSEPNMHFTILTYDTLDSTNTEAIKQAKLGADEGVCVVARQQTAGRGRHGRTWVSERDAGLYFSIILRPKIEAKFLPLITLMAAAATYDTLVELGIAPDIKWVNDILVNEKKIAGILAETTETAEGVAVVVGIGINLRSINFPPEIADRATSIENETASDVTSKTLSKRLAENLVRSYEVLTSAGGPANIRESWRRRSSYFSGKSVRVATGNKTVTGITDGLEDNGALRVRQDDGTIAIIQTGDVERLRTEAD